MGLSGPRPTVRVMAVSLGERIRLLRTDQASTLAQLAGIAGISTSYLNDIEHDRTAPTLMKLYGIASALGISVVELLRGVSPYDD